MNELMRRLVEAILKAFIRGWGVTSVGDVRWGDTPSREAIKYAIARAGDIVTDIDNETMDRVNSLVQQAVENGWTANQLQDRLIDHEGGPFGRNRALMIARTETAFAYNRGEASRWREDGIRYVEIIDGTGDAICREANGAVWTIENYLAHPVGHPNCQRSAVPIEQEDERGLDVSRPHEDEEKQLSSIRDRQQSGGSFGFTFPSVSTTFGGQPTPNEFLEGV